MRKRLTPTTGDPATAPASDERLDRRDRRVFWCFVAWTGLVMAAFANNTLSYLLGKLSEFGVF